MNRSDRLAGRIAPHLPAVSTRQVGRLLTADAHGLRARLLSDLECLVARFELDRAIFEIELDAQQEWLDRLERFDAYCARRDAR